MIAQLFRVYGEEPRARAIAAAIVAQRDQAALVTTADLARVVEEAVGRPRRRASKGKGKRSKHPATRVFQACARQSVPTACASDVHSHTSTGATHRGERGVGLARGACAGSHTSFASASHRYRTVPAFAERAVELCVMSAAGCRTGYAQARQCRHESELDWLLWRSGHHVSLARGPRSEARVRTMGTSGAVRKGERCYRVPCPH